MEDPQVLLQQADKKLNSNWISSWMNGNTRFTEAGDLCTKAANIYKIQKNNVKAGEALCRAAQAYQQGTSKFQAAQSWIGAANCFKGSNFEEAISSFNKGIEFYTDSGKFVEAAKYKKEIAEMYEKESNIEAAMENFNTAGEYYESENAGSASHQCFLKVGQYAAELGDYDRAIDIFERVANNSKDSNLLKWGVKEHLLKAGICHLCTGDIVSVKRALEKYKDMDVSFQSQRECKFLEQITNAVENLNVETFTAAVVEYDNITPLDTWKTSLLLKVKKSIKEEDTHL